jgi:P-type E1-E2 ATPase
VNPGTGLTRVEVDVRRRQHGYNEVAEQKGHPWLRFLGKFWQVIPTRELVPGDIVRVRPGDLILADVKLLTGTVSVDESALTGESKDAETRRPPAASSRRVPSSAGARATAWSC